jgi:MFS family permease
VLPIAGGRLVSCWGWRRLFATGLAVLAVGDLALALAHVSFAPRTQALLGMTVIGTGAALVHPQLSGAVVALVPPHMSGMASAVTIVMRQAGFAIGIALLGALLQAPAVAVGYAHVRRGCPCVARRSRGGSGSPAAAGSIDPHEVVTRLTRRAATADKTRRICLRERGHELAKLSSP